MFNYVDADRGWAAGTFARQPIEAGITKDRSWGSKVWAQGINQQCPLGDDVGCMHLESNILYSSILERSRTIDDTIRLLNIVRTQFGGVVVIVPGPFLLYAPGDDILNGPKSTAGRKR